MNKCLILSWKRHFYNLLKSNFSNSVKNRFDLFCMVENNRFEDTKCSKNYLRLPLDLNHELTVQKPFQISWCSWASKRYSNLQVKSQYNFNLKSNKHQGIFLTLWSTSGWLPGPLISHKMISMISRMNTVNKW